MICKPMSEPNWDKNVFFQIHENEILLDANRKREYDIKGIRFNSANQIYLNECK